MRIAIDGRALTGRFTGDRTYWRNLLHALPRLDSENEYRVYSRQPIVPGELPDALNVRPCVVEAPNDRFWTLFALPQALRQDRADLLHVQYTVPPKRLCPCPVVTTVHDISFRLYPEWFPAKHRLLLNLTVPASMRRAARVITDSESSRQDMLRAYSLAPEKLVGIPLGLPEGFVATDTPDETFAEAQERAHCFANSRFGLDGPFVLAVGVLQPRKNLKTLVEAFGKAKVRFGLPHRLALVGKAGWGTERAALEETLTRHGCPTEALAFTGYVEDAELPILYRACAAFAHPALYEGFGFPPLEAMACGAPALVSDAPAMPEVAGKAALIVPARDVDAWAEALGRLLRDPALAETLRHRGWERCAHFTWEETARRTLEVYREAVLR